MWICFIYWCVIIVFEYPFFISTSTSLLMDGLLENSKDWMNFYVLIIEITHILKFH